MKTGLCAMQWLLRLLALAVMLLAQPAQAAGCTGHDPLSGPVASATVHHHHAAHGASVCACAAAAVLPAQPPAWRTAALPRHHAPRVAAPLRRGRSIAPETPPPIA